MTVSIGKVKHYMSAEQIKQFSDEGNVIASHTWNHSNFKKLSTAKDWEIQLDKPTKKLEEITGKPLNILLSLLVFGMTQNLPQLHKRGFKLAFQLV